MAHVNRRIGKSSESAIGSADGTGGGVLDIFLQEYFNRSGNVYNHPGRSNSGIVASGGVTNEYVDGQTIYKSHVFTSSGTFTVTAGSADIQYLVVAGGGGGGGGYAGAGGAGGLKTSVPGVQKADGTVLTAPDFPVSPGSYTVTIGAGGQGGATISGSPGGNTVFGSITAHGGGRGGGNPGISNADINGDSGES